MIPLPDDLWRRDALCRGQDPNLFHPSLFGSGYTRGVTEEHLEADVAKYWCGECPVRGECLEDALVNLDRASGAAPPGMSAKRCCASAEVPSHEHPPLRARRDHPRQHPGGRRVLHQRLAAGSGLMPARRNQGLPPHGTAARYRRGGCRCLGCRTADVEQRDHGDVNKTLLTLPRPTGPLTATCWCERKTVTVSPADVRSGRTGTCGDDACTPPRGAA